MSQARFRVVAKGFFFDSNDRVVLVRGTQMRDGKQFWCAPGGGVEEGETLFQAMERELKEETGFNGTAQRVVFMQELAWGATSRCFEIFVVGQLDESAAPSAKPDHKIKFFKQEEFEGAFFLPPGLDPFAFKNHSGIEYRPFNK